MARHHNAMADGDVGNEIHFPTSRPKGCVMNKLAISAAATGVVPKTAPRRIVANDFDAPGDKG